MSKFTLVPAEVAQEMENEFEPSFWEKVHSDVLLDDGELEWLLSYKQRKDAEAVACENAAAAHSARAKRCRAQGEALFAEICERLRAHVQAKLGDSVSRNTLVGRFRVQLRKQQPELVVDDDFCEHNLNRFVRVIPAQREPDKKAIREALLIGEDVQGAALVERPDSVSVELGLKEATNE